MDKKFTNWETVPWENVNMKLRIGKLLFDFLFDDQMVPQNLDVFQEKHNHAAIEVQFVLPESGQGALIIDEKEHAILPASIHIIEAHVFHAVRPNPGQKLRRSTFRFTFQITHEQDDWFPHTEAERVKALLTGFSYCGLHDHKRNIIIFNLLEEIREEISSPSIGFYTIAQSLFAQLIIKLVREIRRDHQWNETYTMPSKVKDDQRSRIIDLFFYNYKQHLTLDMLAKQLSLSERQTNRLLRQQFNTSFKQKLVDTRVEVAKYLLRTTKLSVEDIAYEVGYSSTHYFIQLFQQKAGVTPSEYRATQ